MQITTINVWTTADPYRGDTRENALADLAAHHKDNFWGNICVDLDYSTLNKGRSGKDYRTGSGHPPLIWQPMSRLSGIGHIYTLCVHRMKSSTALLLLIYPRFFQYCLYPAITIAYAQVPGQLSYNRICRALATGDKIIVF